MTPTDDIEQIKLALKESYPNIEFLSYHNSITAKISMENAPDYVLLELTNTPSKDIISIHEENWLRNQKWICYNWSYTEMYGHGSRFGGEDPIEVFKGAVESLRYRLNTLIERAKLSEIFLQKTTRRCSNDYSI